MEKEALDARDAQFSLDHDEDDDLAEISELLAEKQDLESSIQSSKADCKKEAAQIRSEATECQNNLQNAAPEDEQVQQKNAAFITFS